MHPPTCSTHLAITNPLVKYRSLVATKQIRQDPAQHRLALQLQKLYYRLKDYNPELEYRYRLDQISRTSSLSARSQPQPVDEQQRLQPRLWNPLPSLWRNRSQSDVLALVRTKTIHASALSIDSPQGLLLHGEVGRGKSMLLDLFADSLPSGRKRRWHFSTFILDTFHRLEQIRLQRGSLPKKLQGFEEEHNVLTLAKDTIAESPILFLDEFQLPDRATSKLLNSFLTSFFHLGGVLIASSNRMPDDLATAAGVEYSSQLNRRGSVHIRARKRSGADKVASADFGTFLEVLKARCEVWEMEGDRDWRRDEAKERKDVKTLQRKDCVTSLAGSEVASPSGPSLSEETSFPDHPQNYHISQSLSSIESSVYIESEWNTKIESLLAASTLDLASQTWSPTTIRVYGRQVVVPAATREGYTFWTFADLCAMNLGPADYVSLTSRYHTLVLDAVPVLSLVQKNEARRFITLLDALYESRCRLLIRAAAPPDQIFFPQGRASEDETADGSGDEVYQETLAEIYQDSTSPFRPNVSSYSSDLNKDSELDTSASPTASLITLRLRSVLVDEDADFRPIYGNGRGYDLSNHPETQQADRRLQQDRNPDPTGPDFTKTAALTGEDERFAFKRATSRIWEMCGERWWTQRPSNKVDEWWRPIEADARFWEKSTPHDHGAAAIVDKARGREDSTSSSSSSPNKSSTNNQQNTALFSHGASPFRTSPDPPPRFGWQHAWGMMTWGKKAGEWGKGVEGARKKK